MVSISHSGIDPELRSSPARVSVIHCSIDMTFEHVPRERESEKSILQIATKNHTKLNLVPCSSHLPLPSAPQSSSSYLPLRPQCSP